MSLVCAWGRIQPPELCFKACTKLSSSSFITSAAPASSRFQISQDQMNTKAWSIWSFCPSLPRTPYGVPTERAFPRLPSSLIRLSIDRFQRGELPQPIKHLPLQASDTATQQQTRGYRVISHASKSSQEPPSRIPSARKAGSPVSSPAHFGFNWHAMMLHHDPEVRLPDPGIPPYFP